MANKEKTPELQDLLGRALKWTLKEALRTTGDSEQDFGESSAIQVFPTRHEAWRYYVLKDYIVSSTASGPSLILVPR